MPLQEALQLLLMQNPPPPWVTDANQWYPESYNTIPKGLRPSETLKAGTGTAGGVTGTYKTRVSAGAPINANASGPRPCERQAVNRRPLSAGHMPSSGLNNMRANRGKVTRLVENQYKVCVCVCVQPDANTANANTHTNKQEQKTQQGHQYLT